MKTQKYVLLLLALFIFIQPKAYPRCKPVFSLSTGPHIIAGPISPGGRISPEFNLMVNGMPVPVEKIGKFSAAPVDYALIEWDGVKKLDFELTASSPIGQYTISPQRLNIMGRVKSNKLSFSITRPQYIVIQISGSEDLFILVDPVDKNAPKPGGVHIKNILDYKGVDPSGKINSSVAINKAISDISASQKPTILYFPPGKYLSKQIDMKSNVTVYLAGGALIQATDDKNDYPNKAIVSWDHVSNSKFLGRGIIDGNGTAMGHGSGVHIMEVNLSNNCFIEGITERDSPFWTNHIFECNHVQYENIKVINYRPKIKVNNTDGLNFDCSSDCGLHNGFFYTGDDNCVVKGTGKGSAYNVHNIVFDTYIGYSNSAACKIGTETTIDSISNITFKNADIIRCDRALVIDAFDNAKITSVNFQHINIEGIAPNGEGNEPSKFIEFIVTNKGWRESAGTASIKDIKVEDIFALFDPKKFPSDVSGVSEVYNIGGLLFRHVAIKDDQGKEQLINNPDEGNIKIGAFVSGIKFVD